MDLGSDHSTECPTHLDAGHTTYTYDPAGNRLTAGSDSYAYDGFGNLASATAGATTIAYRTNGAGLRVSATSGGTTTTYAWDAAAALPSLLSDGTNGYLSADSMLLAETASSANAYPLTDALGSVRGQSNQTGAVTASASYGAYGDVRSSSGSVGSLGYTGALSDASNLVYLNARSMDPATGTFTSRDPMTPGGPGVTGFNPYAYAGQNPTTYTDPSGRFALVGYELPQGITIPPAVKSLAVIGAMLAGGTGVFVLAFAVFNKIWLCLISHEGVCHLFNQSRSNSSGGSSGGGGSGGGGGGGPPHWGSTGNQLVDDLLRGLRSGSRNVYEVDTEAELNQLWDQLSAGGTPDNNAYPGQRVRLQDGTTVGIRQASKSGGVTIDIQPLPGKGPHIEIHVPGASNP